MRAPPESRVETLVRFSRIAVGSETPEAIRSLLVEAARAQCSADAVVLVEVADETLRVMDDAHAPAALRGWHVELEVLDASIGARLVATCGPPFRSAQVFPMMGHGALFGALVLLFHGEQPDESTLEIAFALTDLASLALGRSFKTRELEQAYEQLRQSRVAQARAYKLGALGQMAAGVSHDLKNILNPLAIHLQLLQRSVAKDNADAHESITAMREVINRGVETIDRLRDFSRQTPVTASGVVDVNALATEATELARARLVSARARHVTLQTELGAPPPVKVQPAELIAALVNLIVNGIDALRARTEPGNITVRTGTKEGYAVILVEDDGPGMTQDVAHRVFEPFFSTKGDEGTGLGLANVYAFARRYGGDVSLDTRPGAGARFTIELPAADEQP